MREASYPTPLLPALLATAVFSTAGWIICEQTQLTMPASASPLTMSALCGVGLDPAVRIGLVMTIVCPPPLPVRSLATRTGVMIATIWLVALAIVAKLLILTEGAALGHGITWFSQALGITLLLVSLAPTACVWRCFTVMVMLLRAGLMSAPWMLGCALLMRLDVLRPNLALGRSACVAAAACLALGIA